MRTISIVVVVVLGLAATGCGKSGEAEPRSEAKPRKWETKGYRETTPEAREAALAALAAVQLGLSAEWMEHPSRDGKRTFNRNDVTLDLYLADAEDLVAIADEPPATLAELVARTKPGAAADEWPFGYLRFKAVADQGSSGAAFWIRGPMQKNDRCGDTGCDPAGWQDSGEVAFVVYRSLGAHRFRCTAHGLDLGGGNAALTEAFTACKAMTAAAK